MRLLFVSSCLEPGRDGVGDYLRLLAGACARLGHTCALLALNDPFVKESTTTAVEEEGAAIPVHRLAADLPWAHRTESAATIRREFGPDWISFHIVPYAFHRRGILLDLAAPFRAWTEGTSLHLMFHELWLGAGRPSTLSDHLTGWFQRRGVQRLLAQLHPKLVTASNPVYVAMLRSLHAEAEILPLFGNVPVVASTPARLLSGLPATAGITVENRGDWWIGIFFGALHRQWEPAPLMGPLLRAAQRTGKRICLVLVGHAGASGEAIWKQLQADFAPEIVFVHMGLQPVETISALLQLADFGLAASPWQLLGKSGTVAAMLDHGLPVLVTRDDFQPSFRGDRPPSGDPLVHRCDGDLENKLVAGLPKRPPLWRGDEIAAGFCHRLQALSPSTP